MIIDNFCAHLGSNFDITETTHLLASCGVLGLLLGDPGIFPWALSWNSVREVSPAFSLGFSKDYPLVLPGVVPGVAYVVVSEAPCP